MNELLHSMDCEMTSSQFVAWLRGVANSIEEIAGDVDANKAYKIGEWLHVACDTQTRESCPCETPSNHKNYSRKENKMDCHICKKGTLINVKDTSWKMCNSCGSFVDYTTVKTLESAQQSVQPTPESGRDLPAESSDSKVASPAESG